MKRLHWIVPTEVVAVEAAEIEPEPTATDEPAPTAEPEVVAEPTSQPEPTAAEVVVEEVAEAAGYDQYEYGAAGETEADTDQGENVAEESNDVAAEGASLYEIDSTVSTARFELDEDLNGNRITVVGVADQVAAQLRFDPADLSSAEIGSVTINARTFATDNGFRNNAIQNRILNTGQFEFITFVPSAINGLPAAANADESINFEVVGALTIRDVTLPVTFQMAVTLNGDGALNGTGSALITLAEYGINIPQVPSVANVEDELELYIDFVANPASN